MSEEEPLTFTEEEFIEALKVTRELVHKATMESVIEGFRAIGEDHVFRCRDIISGLEKFIEQGEAK